MTRRDHKNKEEKGGAGPADQGGDFFGGLTKWVQEVRRGPGAAVTGVGLLIVVVAFVSKIGSIDIVGRASVVPTAGIGILMIVGGLWWTRRVAEDIEGDYDPIVLDRAFMLKVFQETMPPAFIKREPADGKIPDTGLEHILESRALLKVQDETKDISNSDPRFKEIIADHIAGDKAALDEHRSYYLELASYLAGDEETPILTFKTRVTHKGSRYVVGWYVPIQLDKDWPHEDRISLVEEAGQLLKFRLAKAQGKHGRMVNVGGAIRSRVP